VTVRLAFAGFRHFHILDLYEYAAKSPRIDVVAAAEDHPQTASDVAKKGVALTHATVERMLQEADTFDAVAIGDYYGRRGSLAIAALEAGKHVILDKPICTDIDELEQIACLSRERGLVVGCMLDSRDTGQFITLKTQISDGVIGSVQAVSFLGHHPLLFGTRASWYFEEEKQGGTINDIAIHAIDLIPWLTGKSISEVVAARVWNSSLEECPHFQVGAQLMLALDGGAGVIGDVSYLSPDSQGYKVPQYWRYTVHGTGGILETGKNSNGVQVWQDGRNDGYTVQAAPDREGGVFEDFLNEIDGKKELCDLTSDQALASTRKCLEIQKAADTGRFTR
jgi:predicted dehydrogenase